MKEQKIHKILTMLIDSNIKVSEVAHVTSHLDIKFTEGKKLHHL